MADATAGVRRDWLNDEAGAIAWAARAEAARDANGFRAAWIVARDVDAALSPLVGPYLNDPMQTLPGIVLKAALGEWWTERTLIGLSRLAAGHFGLPFDEPAPFEIGELENDADDASV
ncbi:hypothetical protein FV232_27265 [Methylobacterium sp. WL30]|uniref:hypothetical protein n=1 Tax=unclassified Methylobacterium TaxID=2615210 RepID=UPI0011C7CDCF|nr:MULTISPECIES: hypothetical protein [unclassified Methylobacterium]TXN28827.1 hypothetical protein FV225_20840 [Methylobacterium sp. WL93]TXN50023.1 hypothetical protein FV227_14185 [Methylobacterium sp. WL119]TXN61333.1 hypothetical protein FV232_27265 [Methylobacterium sp. WL30]